MKTSEAFPSKFLKASDIENGHRLQVTIEKVEMTDIGDDGDKPVVYFRGQEKGLVLNVTNAHMIEEISNTDEMDNWRNVDICLFATKVDYQGRRVAALRVDHPDRSKTAGNGNGAKPLVQQPLDNTNWKLVLNEKLKAHCTAKQLDWDTQKLELLDTYAGSKNFAGLTVEQAKQACINLADPDFLPF